jgi:hypothetical protein
MSIKTIIYIAAFVTAIFSAPANQFWAHGANASESKSIRERGLQCINKGSLAEGDSLLSVADSTGALSAVDCLRWLETKAVLSKYGDAARLCCKITAREPRLSAMACGRFMQMIEEQSAAVKREALAVYRQCALSGPGCDTLRVKQWLSHAYATFALFVQQDSILVQLDTRKYPSAQDFLEAAQERFSQGFVADAVFPAKKAYNRLDNTAEKSLAATMVFQWYRSVLKPDSASFWLSRASLSDERFKVAAVAFLQSAGMLDRADSLMATLRSSVSRDTLMLRRMLFAGEAKGAYAKAGSLVLSHDAAVVWKMRTALFCGNGADLYGWIDTVSFSPASEWGEEIMSYRYRLEVIASASVPQAMRDFCALSYALWCGKPDKAAAIRLTAYPREVRDLLVCDIVKAFIQEKRFGEAGKTAAASGPDSAGPELRYYYADALIQQGYLDEGAAMLEQLLLANPNDVFSGRSRILLESLKKKK